jgi:hypothetical protein
MCEWTSQSRLILFKSLRCGLPIHGMSFRRCSLMLARCWRDITPLTRPACRRLTEQILVPPCASRPHHALDPLFTLEWLDKLCCTNSTIRPVITASSSIIATRQGPVPRLFNCSLHLWSLCQVPEIPLHRGEPLLSADPSAELYPFPRCTWDNIKMDLQVTPYLWRCGFDWTAWELNPFLTLVIRAMNLWVTQNGRNSLTRWATIAI